jgi:hypothetical protein
MPLIRYFLRENRKINS